MLKIPDGAIHIWFSLTEKLNDLDLLAQYENLLSEEESKQCKSFLYKTDRDQYLISRALLRETLSKYSYTHPHDWKFSRSINGKPFINQNEKNLDLNKFTFNLTHTDGLVLIGLTKAIDIGVDVERISRECDYMDIVRSNFMENEITALESMYGIDQRESFYKYWTLKESYLKARGEGLTMPLNLFGFTFSSHRKIVCSFSNELEDCPTNWKFLQFSPAENYVSSICVESNENYFPKISVRHSIPLIGDTKLKNIDFWSS